MEITSRIHSIPAEASPDYSGPMTGPMAPNVFLLTDGGEGALVDSGFGDEKAIAARLEYLRERPQIVLRYIILSHYHFDHSSGAHQLRQATGAQIVIHPEEERPLLDWKGEIPQDVEETPERKELAERFKRFRQMAADAVPDLRLGDGESLKVGGLTLDILHTPGHTMGSVCVYAREERALFMGDTALGLGTVAIAPPPHGDMALYLQSLERLKGFDSALMLAGHGPPVHDVARKLQEIIDHRHEREEQILMLIADGRRTPKAIVNAIYPELAQHTVPIAVRQVEAHLAKLLGEGRVERAGDEEWTLQG
jgi:glyoxylase-like metal-dependent hydrolase (beta-lactamase superfamily II)